LKPTDACFIDRMIEQLSALRLIPVVAIETVEQAEPLADALVEGGLPCIEITLRTQAALEAIRALAGREQFLLGGGTVHGVDHAKAVVDAGARFVVTPGFNPRTVTWCLENKVPIFPGVATPTDLEMAMEHGIEVVKFFPAQNLGGVKMLKALSGPYGGIRFIPTGGIDAANLKDYLDLPCVLACGGSWMVRAELIREGRFADVKELVHEAMRQIRAL
jgi:2-dehydro-3-deoxyphosphogluconate aldolase/(4S)-4-hydroxy-2-oxoglutarate aldolase